MEVVVLERFTAKYTPNPVTECWEWNACRDQHGYGLFRNDGQMRRAHRLAYQWLVGPIPEGLVLDHLCRVRHCVNPKHLEPVTMQVNVLRGLAPAAKNVSKTHCIKGHEFTEENTYVWRRKRNCRACMRLITIGRRKRHSTL